MSSPVPEDLNRALDRLIAGDLPVAEANALQEKMKVDSNLLSLYLEKVRMESLLRDHAWNGSAAAPSKQPQPSSPSRTRARIFTGQHLAWAAAVTLLLGILGVTFLRHSPQESEPPMAVMKPSLEFSAASEYTPASPGAAGNGDGSLPYGEGIVMKDGAVSIRLPSGVKAVLKSPSRFAITGPNRLKLDEGSGWFRVPEQGKGFAVDLPGMEVVDLGTIFTVRAGEAEQQVQVEQGRVEVRQRGEDPRPQILTQGEMLVRRSNAETVESTRGMSLLDPASTVEKTEVVFREDLTGVPDQPFADRKPQAGTWTVLEGRPQVHQGRFSAESNFTHLMGRFTRPIEPSENAVIIVSFKSVSPVTLFHSKGFAGVSLFDGNGELFFLGDKGANSYSWELLTFGKHYRGPQEERRAYDMNVQGSEETFTLRYRQRTGAFEVYRGWGVQGLPVARGRTDPGLRVDGVRVANGRGGDFSFVELQVSVARDTAK